MFCFKKHQRLRKRPEFDFVFKSSQKIVTTAFVVFFLKNQNVNARLGLALSKKSIAHACDRNRMKRLIRESFRYETLPSVDLVFIARQGILKLNKADINNSLQSIWEKLKHI